MKATGCHPARRVGRCWTLILLCLLSGAAGACGEDGVAPAEEERTATILLGVTLDPNIPVDGTHPVRRIRISTYTVPSPTHPVNFSVVSLDPEVATVADDRYLTAVAPGIARIMAVGGRAADRGVLGSPPLPDSTAEWRPPATHRHHGAAPQPQAAGHAEQTDRQRSPEREVDGGDAQIGPPARQPLDTARSLVTKGPYAWVRNPMAIAGLLQGTGVALFLGSPIVLVYVLAGGLLWQLLVRPVEERDLLERFGAGYTAYRASVRCWIPRRPSGASVE